jgi:hypothetical protein
MTNANEMMQVLLDEAARAAPPRQIADFTDVIWNNAHSTKRQYPF